MLLLSYFDNLSKPSSLEQLKISSIVTQRLQRIMDLKFVEQAQ